MKKKQKKRAKKTPATEHIIIESPQPSRMEAITNLSRAILETARALNTPAVVVRNSHFVSGGKAPSLSIVTGKMIEEEEKI